MKPVNIAIVGATGLVGRTFIQALEDYDLPIGELHLFASPRSIGKKMLFRGKEIVVEELKEGVFKGMDFALFSAGSNVSKLWAPIAEKEGAIVVDNSACWRMEDDCALIVPEINIEDFYNHPSRIIANPNCSTIQCVLPLEPLDRAYGITRICYSTYQAVSGSGQKGVDDYNRCRKGGKNEFYPYDISRTCIPEIDVFLDNGYTKEEMKMVNETRKILHRPGIAISATCVRVPVERAHAVSIEVSFAKKPDLHEVRSLLANKEGVKVLDDPKNHIYPVSTQAKGNDLVYVGRIREDLSLPNSLLLYTVGDNIRKGAAANAVQIVKKLMERGIEK